MKAAPMSSRQIPGTSRVIPGGRRMSRTSRRFRRMSGRLAWAGVLWVGLLAWPGLVSAESGSLAAAGELSTGSPAALSAPLVELQVESRVEPLQGLEARSAALLLSGQRGGRIIGDLLWSVGTSAAPGEVEVPFFVELDGASLVAGLDEETASGPGPAELELELHVYLLDDDAVASSVSQLIRLSGPDRASLLEAIRRRGVKLVGRLFTTAGSHSIAALVRERASDRFFVTRSRLDLGDGTGAMTPLLPPVFADLHEGWIAVPLQGLGADSFRLALTSEPLVPAALPALVRGRSAELLLAGGAWPEGAQLSAALHFRKGRVVEVTSLDPGRARKVGDGGLWVRHASLRPPDLHPGIYDLELRLVDREGVELAIQLQPVAVVPELEDGAGAGQGTVRALAVELGSSTKRATYRRALRLLAEGQPDAGRQLIDDLETRTLAEEGSEDLDRLRKAERRVVERLLDESQGAAAPVVKLHHDLYHVYMLRSDYLLESHAWQLTADLAELAADEEGDLVPMAVQTLVSLAGYQLDNEDQVSASSLLERALRLEPEDRAALMTLAAIQERRGEYRRAVDVLRQLVAVDPGWPEARLRLAINVARLERPEEAAELLRVVVDDCSQSWTCSLAYQELALIMGHEQQAEQAAALLAEGIARLPDSQRLEMLRAYLLERSGRAAEADAVLESIRPPRDPLYTSPRWQYTQWPDVGLSEMRRLLDESAAAGLEALAAALGPEPPDEAGSSPDPPEPVATQEEVS